MTASRDLEQLCIDTMRTLAMDAVQQADSGHPGTPMALAPAAFAIWDGFLRHNPKNPCFANRDRFVLSCGHASMLLYGVLHLSGYEVALDDIKQFRQLGSKCAGHPEYRECPGVETTTGPLGQGIANTVGMALAERYLAAHFNRPGFAVVDYQVIALASDGDIMEGLGAEAASLAGHLRLDNLTWVYDRNRITIEGNTDLAFTEDVPARFRAYGWAVSHVADANDVPALTHALEQARARTDKPTLIVVDSHIAWGAPNAQDTAASHGAPLGDDEIRATKLAYGWDPAAQFLVPTEAKDYLTSRALERGAAAESEWNAQFARYEKAHPDLARAWRHLQEQTLPEGWDADLPQFPADPKGMASRAASGKALNALAKRVPWLLGGSADLGSSNKTEIAGAASFSASDRSGRNLHFGVREHAMGSIANGMALAGLRPYTGTFFVFSDYMRPVHRLAALMKLPVIFVYTHDSIGVGEDGPTHQPIEHLPSLRAIPGLDVIRPGDANEVVEAWRIAMTTTDRPVALVVSRQSHPTLDRTKFAAPAGLARGAYVLADAKGGKPDVILMASGSELGLVTAAWEQLVADGVKARLVSFPCWERFSRQDAAYRESVLPNAVRGRVAVEAASPFGWERWVGLDGAIIGRDDYGASAPGKVLFETFGFTVDAVVAAARAQLDGGRTQA